MIYTVTLNPSIDFLVRLPEFKVGEVNRMTSDDKFPGGKGINVSRILARLDSHSTALGFLGGFTGAFIKEKLEAEDIQTDFVKIASDTRINVKIKSSIESEINGAGPVISKDKVEELMKKLEELGEGDVLFLAGSIPSSMPDDMYEQIMARLDRKGVMIVVDATKDLLVNVLKYHPFLVKPNNHELGEIFGVELKTRKDVIPYGKKLQEKGARNVLVSMAGDGAILITEEGEVHVTPCPKGEVKNSVGAGDSMVAGFITGYLRSNGDYNEALKMGTAAGSATAFSEDVATGEKIMKLYKTL